MKTVLLSLICLFLLSSCSGSGTSMDGDSNTFAVTANPNVAYIVNGSSNPTLTVVRGQTYTFSVNAAGHPFHLMTAGPNNNVAPDYNNGVTGNGTASGTITWAVPIGEPLNTIYYNCSLHAPMGGTINITN